MYHGGMKEHIADRFARAVRPFVIAGIYLCLPIYLFSSGWGLKQLMFAAPWWVSVIVVISHFVTWLGIASLFDMQQERRQSLRDAQSVPPEHH